MNKNPALKYVVKVHDHKKCIISFVFCLIWESKARDQRKSVFFFFFSFVLVCKWYLGHVNECRKILINNLIKKSFYGKTKKTINILIIFFIFHKSGVKTFLKLIINHCPKGEIIKSSSGPRHLSTIPLKNFHLFKITKSVINLCLKKKFN